jgi:uncharacterized protein (TIGR03066 family)
MSTLRLLVAGVMLVALTTDTRAEKKEEKADNAKLLVGAWEVTKTEKDAPLAVGTTVEFGRDGKVKTTAKKDDKEVVKEGTYEFEKGKLIIKMAPNNPNVLSIKKLTDTELVIAHDEGGKVIEFKRKK